MGVAEVQAQGSLRLIVLQEKKVGYVVATDQ